MHIVEGTIANVRLRDLDVFDCAILHDIATIRGCSSHGLSVDEGDECGSNEVYLGMSNKAEAIKLK